MKTIQTILFCLFTILTAEVKKPNIFFAIADDWGWPHAGSYGDNVVKTPTFDKIAKEGLLYNQAYCSSPSCTPSRAAILTGQWHWRLEESANLWSTLNSKFDVYTDILEKSGYHVGYTRKGWGPGKIEVGGRNQNPAGKKYENFDQYLLEREENEPLCFWFGSYDPHRVYEKGSGKNSGIDIKRIDVPDFFPTTDIVKNDIADYYFEVERFDREVGEIIKKLKEMNEFDNTIVVITGDHGMPFPRCKSNLYDMGVRVPLAISWTAKIKNKGRNIDDFVSLIDLAPTFLESAGIPIPKEMNGKSLIKTFSSEKSEHINDRRNFILTGKERHVPAQEAPIQGGYPSRAIRNHNFLLIWNIEPSRWPAGTPNDDKAYFEKIWLGDADPGGTKNEIVRGNSTPEGKRIYQLNFGKRPEFELYDVQRDSFQILNIAYDPVYKILRENMFATLKKELRVTKDPRMNGKGELLESYPYYGGGPTKEGFKDQIK